jgi:hypothetical protein
MSAPTVVGIPHPGLSACPVCGRISEQPVARCRGCGVDLTHPAAALLSDANRRWRELDAERAALITLLTATRAVEPARRPTWAPPEPADRMAGPEAVQEPQPRTGTAHRPRLGVPTLLALAGITLLIVAAVVFVAMTWETLPSLAQAAILVAATALSATAALLLDRRGIHTAAAALGVLTMGLAAVDVVAIEQGGLEVLDEFVVAVAAVAAAAAGWALGRRGLRWVSTAGAVATVLAGASAALAVGVRWVLFEMDPVVALLSLATTACSIGVAASVPLWRTRSARWIAALGAGVGLTAAGAIGLWELAVTDIAALVGLGIVALPIALLLVGTRWTVWTLTPAVLLASTLPWALLVALAVIASENLMTFAAATVVVAWSATRISEAPRWAVLAGGLPAATITASVTISALGGGILGLAGTLGLTDPRTLEPWVAATAVLGILALFAIPHGRTVETIGWGVAVGLFVLAPALPVGVVWPALLTIAVVASALPAGRRLDPLAAPAIALLGVGWAAGESWTLAVSAVVSAAIAAVARRRGGPARSAVATGLALFGCAVATAATFDAAGASLDVTLGAALVTATLGAVVVGWLRLEDPPVAAAIVAGAAVLVLPPFASSPRIGGVLLLLAAPGWLVAAVLGRRPARWVAVAIASVGSGLIVADAGIETVEAYTLVPAGLLTGAGVWWLAEARQVRTFTALWPALSVGLLPSLVVLTGDPRVLSRTLGLSIAAGVLATAGVRLRWQALVVAGSLTAVWVALTQLFVVSDLLPRWVTFAVVGVVLVWLAATYERQQQRVRSARNYLDELR